MKTCKESWLVAEIDCSQRQTPPPLPVYKSRNLRCWVVKWQSVSAQFTVCHYCPSSHRRNRSHAPAKLHSVYINQVRSVELYPAWSYNGCTDQWTRRFVVTRVPQYSIQQSCALPLFDGSQLMGVMEWSHSLTWACAIHRVMRVGCSRSSLLWMPLLVSHWFERRFQ